MPTKTLGCELRDLIHYLYEDTLLPELFELIGEEKTIEIIKVFGGTKIEIPAYKKLLELQRNIDIYETLSYAHSQETVLLLAEKYEITDIWVRQLYSKMREKYPKIQAYMEKLRNPHTVAVTTKRRPVYAKKDLQK